MINKMNNTKIRKTGGKARHAIVTFSMVSYCWSMMFFADRRNNMVQAMVTPLTELVFEPFPFVLKYGTNNCSGAPQASLDDLPDGRHSVQAVNGSADWQVLFLDNGTVYETFGEITSSTFVNLGIDCTSDPHGAHLVAAYAGGVSDSACDEQASSQPKETVKKILLPSDNGGNYCTRVGPSESYLVRCPHTEASTASSSPTISPSNSPSPVPSAAPSVAPSSAPSVSPTIPLPTVSPTTKPPSKAPTSGICAPQYRMKKKACKKRIKQCNGQSIRMKWTGPGCKIGRKKVGDGGCQCRGYCGYTCKAACRKDKECKWENGMCMTKNGLVGHPMTSCFPQEN